MLKKYVVGFMVFNKFVIKLELENRDFNGLNSYIKVRKIN